MFVPDLRCLPRRQSIPPAHPVRARRPRSQDGSAPAHPVRARRPRPQDGTRCTAACGRDARTPRVAPSTARGRDARAPRTAAHLRTRCGRDARAPRTALDAPLPAGGTLALPGRHSMHRCLRVGRPRTQDGSAPAHPVRAGRSHSQDGTRCTAACGRDARAPRVAPSTSRGRDARASRVAPSTSRGRDARAPRKASCQSEFGITLSRDRALRSLPPVRARVRTAIPAHTHTTSSGGGATAPRFRFPRR